MKVVKCFIFCLMNIKNTQVLTHSKPYEFTNSSVPPCHNRSNHPAHIIGLI